MFPVWDHIAVLHLHVTLKCCHTRLRCVEGAPDAPAFVGVLAANRMQQCCLLLSQAVLLFHILVLKHPEPLLRNTWSLRPGVRGCARRADSVGQVYMLRGWVLLVNCFSARSSSAETDRFFVQRVTEGSSFLTTFSSVKNSSYITKESVITMSFFFFLNHRVGVTIKIQQL